MTEEITEVEVRDRETEICITNGQDGGCRIVLEPDTKIYHWSQDGKFYIKADEDEIAEKKNSTWVSGTITEQEKKKMNKVIKEKKFQSELEFVGKAVREFLKNY